MRQYRTKQLPNSNSTDSCTNNKPNNNFKIENKLVLLQLLIPGPKLAEKAIVTLESK